MESEELVRKLAKFDLVEVGGPITVRLQPALATTESLQARRGGQHQRWEDKLITFVRDHDFEFDTDPRGWLARVADADTWGRLEEAFARRT